MKLWARFIAWRIRRANRYADAHAEIMRDLISRRLMIQKRAEALSNHAVELYRLSMRTKERYQL